MAGTVLETMTMNPRFKNLLMAFACIGYFLGLIFWHVANASVVFYESPPALNREMSYSVEPPHEFLIAEISAYTSSVDETDESPHENASGGRPSHGSVACPSRFDFGTEIMINGETYTCDDRMNPRYTEGDYFDIWMETKAEAIHFGRVQMSVQVLD